MDAAFGIVSAFVQTTADQIQAAMQSRDFPQCLRAKLEAFSHQRRFLGSASLAFLVSLVMHEDALAASR